MHGTKFVVQQRHLNVKLSSVSSELQDFVPTQVVDDTVEQQQASQEQKVVKFVIQPKDVANRGDAINEVKDKCSTLNVMQRDEVKDKWQGFMGWFGFC